MATAHKSRVLDMTQGDPFRLVLQFSMPLFCSNLLQQLYNLTDTALAGHLLGSAALAEIGATAALYGLIMNFAFGMNNGLVPIIAYNYGARSSQRIQQATRLSLLMTTAIMALGTVICLLASGQLIGLFTSNPDTIAAGAKALRIICIGFVVSAVSTTSSGALEGLGKGVPSLAISLCRYVVFIMPLAAVLCGRLGPDGVWHAFWITEVLTALVAYPVYHRAAARH